jgi:hypothetical protein
MLIRQLVRLTARGWASILTLGVAYGSLQTIFTKRNNHAAGLVLPAVNDR